MSTPNTKAQPVSVAVVCATVGCQPGMLHAGTPNAGTLQDEYDRNVRATPKSVSVLFQMDANRAGAIWAYFERHPKYVLPRGTRDIMVLVEMAMRPSITVGQLHLDLANRGLSIPIPSLYQIMNRFLATDHVRCEIVEDKDGKRLQAFTITQIGCCAVAYYEAIARSKADPEQAVVSLKSITNMEETSPAESA